VSELLMIEQRPSRSRETLAVDRSRETLAFGANPRFGQHPRFGRSRETLAGGSHPRFDQRDAAPWVLEGGRRLPGYDDNRRLAELRRGLMRHPGVRAIDADATDEQVELTLSRLHEPAYLQALRQVGSDEPVVIAELAPPGMPIDIPVRAGLVAAAHEAVRTGITAAQRLAGGARFTYALCRPPGHHAGPGWLAGYCYLNTAAAAVSALRECGVTPVGVLDLDLHYPNGTAAILAPMADTCLHSLHAFPVTNVPALTVCPRDEREYVVEFAASPSAEVYLDAVAISIDALARRSSALVVSLGYDTVAGDPHGSWSFSPSIFTGVGRALAASGLPVCVIQEGGYALHTLAACSDAFARGMLGEGDGGVREPTPSVHRRASEPVPVRAGRLPSKGVPA
jgi:acetoin utilization deacetylase AcuC-like enzyme